MRKKGEGGHKVGQETIGRLLKNADKVSLKSITICVSLPRQDIMALHYNCVPSPMLSITFSDY